MQSSPLTEQQRQQIQRALIGARAELKGPTTPHLHRLTLEDIDQALEILKQPEQEAA